jgi:hypothetical protein
MSWILKVKWNLDLLSFIFLVEIEGKKNHLQGMTNQGIFSYNQAYSSIF